MKKIYTIKDVKEFLFTQGYFWDGNILDNSKNVTIDLFEEPTAIRLITKNYKEIGICLQIDNMTFEMLNAEYDFDGRFDGYYLYYDFTKEWREFLINKYKNYSNIIMEYCLQEEKEIKQQLKQDLIPLQIESQNLKNNAKEKLKEINQLKTYVKEYGETNNF